MSDFKTSNRGGSRPGAGRKSEFDVTPTPKRARGRPVGTTKKNSIENYVPQINPVKELEKLYKELNKVKTKDELLIVQSKIDLLNKLLPYAAMKKPTAMIESNEKEIPNMTVLKVIEKDGEPKEEPKTQTPKEDGDFV